MNASEITSTIKALPITKEFDYLIERYNEMKAICKNQRYFTEAQWDEFLSIEEVLSKIGYIIPEFYSE